MFAADATYELNNPPVIAELLQDEVVAIDLDAGNYYSVRGKAAAVWSALTAGATPEAIVRAADDGTANGALLPALGTFIDRLVADGLLRLRMKPAAGTPAPALAPWTADDLTYEIFTDMQNLLGLDPVHEADERLGWPAPAAPVP